jgi:hypothetical protein
MADDPLADLRAKLRARKGKSGFAANAAELERMIEEAEGSGFVYRETRSYHFVTAEYAEANPSTTFKTRVR